MITIALAVSVIFQATPPDRQQFWFAGETDGAATFVDLNAVQSPSPDTRIIDLVADYDPKGEDGKLGRKFTFARLEIDCVHRQQRILRVMEVDVEGQTSFDEATWAWEGFDLTPMARRISSTACRGDYPSSEIVEGDELPAFVQRMRGEAAP